MSNYTNNLINRGYQDSYYINKEKSKQNHNNFYKEVYKELCESMSIKLMNEEKTVEMLKQEIRKEKKLNKKLINRFVNTINEIIENGLCIICMENPKNCIPYPCNHFKFCKECLQKCKNKCPYCRIKFENILDIY